ncbi:MAG: AAA family ATPase [Candidatus Kapabacteria bacterium]|nr:AAA family ATPase [Candidatus Kapabacteria bacterium]
MNKTPASTDSASSKSARLLPAPTHPSLPVKSLRWYADSTAFPFPSTAHVDPLNGIIGQQRALDALTMGAEIASPGYNIFVSGLSGTGRLTTIKSILERITPNGQIPHDYAYVNNFHDPDQPTLLKFPKGKAAPFQRAMHDAISFLQGRIPKMFEEETFRTGRTKIIEEFQQREQQLLRAFEEELRPDGFTLGQVKAGNGAVQPEILPVINGKAYPIAALDQLVKENAITAEQARAIGENYTRRHRDLYQLARNGMKLSQEFQQELGDFEAASAKLLIEATLDDLAMRFPFEAVIAYLEEVGNDILNNLDLFKQPQPEAAAQGTDDEAQPPASDDGALRTYQVNVVLDNAGTTGAPVIIETTPTYLNLFGTIERVPTQQGFWVSDFLMIKAGAILRADGGYLIINAADALSEPGVWKALKRVLLHRKLEIQPFESFVQSSTQGVAMKPQAIDLNVKVIMIGDPRLYQALFSMEEDFRKIFKISAEFDYEIARTDTVLIEYARFIRKLSDEEHLLHFDPDGVAAVVEYAVEKAGDMRKISLRFSDIADLLREASFWAERDTAEIVGRYHVEKAIRQMVERQSMWKEKIMERMIDGSLLIDTEGRMVGQINGLAVYSVGQISFGKPSRITATVAVGGHGIINIEREARMSGSLHNKGMLIIAGFLRHRFAQQRPLSMTAHIVFEQSYGGVDGDSASSTEIYALLSALSGVPIRQDLAVTGSVNQWGQIQPIGGVKEKVEGFYEVCKARGLTGTQGAMIPVQNIPELMLRDEVVEAVAAGKFHIYPVTTIDQGIEILTGVAAGEPNSRGNYPAGTINHLVQRRLAKLADSLRSYGGHESAQPSFLAELPDGSGAIDTPAEEEE